jgi:integrase
VDQVEGAQIVAGNLYRRGKTWWARFTVDGLEHRQSLRTVHVAEARIRLKKLKDDAEADSFWGGAQMSWETAMTRYRLEVMPAAVKPKTQQRYDVSLRQVSPHLEGKAMHAITTRDLSEMIAARRKARATNATIRRDLTAISRVFAAAKSWGACSSNPARDYDRDMVRERRDPITLPTDEEVRQALAKAPTPLFASIMRFAAETGMRQAEILTLEWRQVDLSRKAITLSKTKTDSPRAVPLEQETVDFLEALPRRRKLVFALEDASYRNFPSNYAVWRQANGVRFRFHDLRHRFAVLYLRKGGNIYALQQILGHASIKTTEIYLAHLTPEERSRATQN